MGQKTFYPEISIKTLENRLVPAKNHKIHPKPKLRKTSLKKLTGEISNLLILLDLYVAMG